MMGRHIGNSEQRRARRETARERRYERRIEFNAQEWPRILSEIHYGLDVDNYIIVEGVPLDDRSWYHRVTAAAYNWTNQSRSRGYDLTATTHENPEAGTVEMWAST
jgi:ribosomal protein L18E